jgi:uncharacterized protein YjbJ (UPF0337 family)
MRTRRVRWATDASALRAYADPRHPQSAAAASTSPSKEFTMNKDQVKGHLKQAEGHVKEVAGKLVGNPTLEAKGKVEQAKGKVQSGVGDIKSAVKHAG